MSSEWRTRCADVLSNSSGNLKIMDNFPSFVMVSVHLDGISSAPKLFYTLKVNIKNVAETKVGSYSTHIFFSIGSSMRWGNKYSIHQLLLLSL